MRIRFSQRPHLIKNDGNFFARDLPSRFRARKTTTDDVYGFDNKFFGITENEANYMDPQQKMLLETSYNALLDAGMDRDMVRGTKIGVFVGSKVAHPLSGFAQTT